MIHEVVTLELRCSLLLSSTRSADPDDQWSLSHIGESGGGGGGGGGGDGHLTRSADR